MPDISFTLEITLLSTIDGYENVCRGENAINLIIEGRDKTKLIQDFQYKIPNKGIKIFEDVYSQG